MFGFQGKVGCNRMTVDWDITLQQLCASSLCASVWSTYRNSLPHSPIQVGVGPLDITDESIQEWTNQMKESGFPKLRSGCCGVLHAKYGISLKKPEHSIWNRCNSLAINAFGPALLSKHIIPLMPRTNRAIFASISKGWEHLWQSHWRVVQLSSIQSSTQYAHQNDLDRSTEKAEGAHLRLSTPRNGRHSIVSAVYEAIWPQKTVHPTTKLWLS